MGILGVIVIILFNNIGYAANKLPAVIVSNKTQSYLDITKPEALRYIKSTLTELMLIEHLSRKGQSKIQEFSQRDHSQNQWENFLSSFKNSVIYQDHDLKTDNTTKNIDFAIEKLDIAYTNALNNHSHYYLKQTIDAHFEYLQTLKHTKDQLVHFKTVYKELLIANKQLLSAINNSFSPNNKTMNSALNSYANLTENLIYDLKFVTTKLEKAVKNHNHYALLEQQNSLSRLHTNENRRIYLASIALTQLQNMARIADTALNLDDGISTKEVISLVESAKKNLNPAFNQIMQVLDFEKILPGNKTLKTLQNYLRSQSEILKNYLLSLEEHSGAREKDSNQINKYHYSFYKQMLENVKAISGLKCKMIFN